MGRYMEAIKTYKSSLKISVRLFREGHERVGMIHSCLGEAYRHQRKLEKAEKDYAKAIQIFSNTAGCDGLMATALLNMGDIYRAKGMTEQAMKHWIESLRLSRVAGSKEGIASGLTTIAKALRAEGRLDEALGNLKEALLIAQSLPYGEKSMTTTVVLQNLGHIYSKQGKIDEALRVQYKALRYIKRARGDKHRDVAVTLCDIGRLYMKKGENERQREARHTNYQEALDMLEKGERMHRALDDDHPGVQTVHGTACINIAICREQLGDREKA